MNRSLQRHAGSQLRLHTRTQALSASRIAPDAGIRRIPSTELFEVGAVVEIEHGGEIYRLRHTRKGKLILTK